MPITTISFNSKVRNHLATTKIAGIDLFNAWNLEDLEKVAEEFLKYEKNKVNNGLRQNLKNNEGKEQEGKEQIKWWVEDEREPRNNEIWPLERFAWFVPAHSNTREYGIHFDVGAILQYAEYLKSKINPKITYENALISVILICFWHMVCHAWVEDFITLHELIDNKRIYTEKRYKLAGFPKVPKEEDLCNTCAIGMLKTFWDKLMPDVNREDIIEAIQKTMKSSGECVDDGYKKFKQIAWYAPSEEEFRKMMGDHLTNTYEVKRSEITESSFFYQNLRGYPLFLEGNLKSK